MVKVIVNKGSVIIIIVNNVIYYKMLEKMKL